ncbi:MAG: aldo/keto reductase [Fibrobacter sp.]|nr:aldo/keto reductase [Fibrobacter sp.]
MKYRTFGNTDLEISEIGLGTWQFGGDWGQITDSVAKAVLDTAIRCGINFFDTADVYGAGRSESIIGNFLKDKNEPVFIATKLGRLEGFPDSYSLELFRRCTENSLKRLGRDCIDLTQLHCVPQNLLVSGEVFDWLRVLQNEGKIRYFGASVETIEEALVCLEQDGLSSLQIIFNIFRQKPSGLLFEKAAQKGVALIIRVPLASGLLSGKFTRETGFEPGDHRSYNRNGEAFNAGETFSGLDFEYGIELTNQLKEYVPTDITMAQFALRWILDHPEISVVIPGASKTSQVESNASASDLKPLGNNLHTILKSFYNEKVDQYIRGRR